MGWGNDGFVLQPQAPLSQRQQELIDEQGWSYYKIIAGPAAGPRNLVTMGLDRHLTGTAATAADKPTWLVGGSFAALRNCAIITHASQEGSGSCADAPTEQLLQAFSDMVYRPGDTADVLARMMQKLFQIVAPRPADILGHPHHRIAIFVTAMQPWAQYVPQWQLKLVFYMLLGANIVSGSVLDILQRRLCFYSGPEPPPFLDPASVTCIPLTEDNLHQVLHATTCLPFLSERCTHISGHGSGIFYDGALGDYCLNFTSSSPDMPVLVLSMEWENVPIKKNIWDSKLWHEEMQTAKPAFVPWRHATADMLRHVTVLSPTQRLRDFLPGRALPSTWDFFSKENIADPQRRIKAWLTAYRLSVEGIPAHPRALIPDNCCSSSQEGDASGQEHSSELSDVEIGCGQTKDRRKDVSGAVQPPGPLLFRLARHAWSWWAGHDKAGHSTEGSDCRGGDETGTEKLEQSEQAPELLIEDGMQDNNPEMAVQCNSQSDQLVWAMHDAPPGSQTQHGQSLAAACGRRGSKGSQLRVPSKDLRRQLHSSSSSLTSAPFTEQHSNNSSLSDDSSE